MKPRVIALIAVLALVMAACTGDVAETPTTTAPDDEPTTTAGAEPTTTAGGETTTTGGSDDPLAEFGESTAADPALVEKALGPVGEVPDVVLASIARASQDLDQATIDKAIECYTNAVECDTGTGGDVIMGYADGGGLNVWRQVTRMEAILQALTYPEIGTIVMRDAQWSADPAVPIGDINFMVERGVTFIIGYPDWGLALGDAIKAAEAAGIPYVPYSAGWVGLPGQDGALTPGTDYLTIVGEDLCALGESFSQVINDGVGEGTIGVLGGTPGNALSLGWQQCHIPTLADGIDVINPPADPNSTTGDTFWANDVARDVVSGWLSTNPDLAGFSYEYADGLYTALDGVEIDEMTIAIRTDEQTLFCDWAERNNPNYRIWYSAGGNFQSRTAVTAQMLNLAGYEVPSEIVVPHVMREVTAADCNPDRVTPTVSGTSLVPDEVLALMYPGG
ncbi:MAG TPA: substrate-binding domain-containing protein [Acidimicrobiia bacterium]|nr:substrate-binding domain-containing protein [Acidimicrobiia bacterium]